MPDAVTITISDQLWQKRMTMYIAYTKKGMLEALSEEWPLLMRKIIDLTPPTTRYSKAGQSALSVGRKAVQRDIYRVMRPLDSSGFKEKSMIRVIERGDVPAMNVILDRITSGPLAGERAVAFDPQLHLAARNARGRVPRRFRRIVIGPDAEALRNYVAHVQANVGTAKAGWAPAYELVATTDTPPLPNWVNRQSRMGTVIDDRGSESNPSITAINQTPWAVRVDDGREIVAEARASRAIAILNKIKTKIRLARKQAEFAGKETT